MADSKPARAASTPPSFGKPMPPVETEDAGPAGSGTAPTPVKIAMALLLISAALNVVSVIITLASRSSIRADAVKQFPDYTSAHIDQVVSTFITAAVVVDLVIAVIFFAMVIFMRKRRNWARIVTWVIIGLFTVRALLSLNQLGGGAGLAIGLVSLAINIAIIASLCHRAANQFFARRPTQRG